MKKLVDLIKKNTLISVLLLVLALVIGGIFFVQYKYSINQGTKTATSSSEVQNKKFVISITVDDGENVAVSDLTSGGGETALELTKKAFRVETQGEGANAFVTSINGRQARQSEREFWELVINNKPSEVGAGSYIVKEGDNIVWRISKY